MQNWEIWYWAIIQGKQTTTLSMSNKNKHDLLCIIVHSAHSRHVPRVAALLQFTGWKSIFSAKLRKQKVAKLVSWFLCLNKICFWINQHCLTHQHLQQAQWSGQDQNLLIKTMSMRLEIFHSRSDKQKVNLLATKDNKIINWL